MLATTCIRSPIASARIWLAVHGCAVVAKSLRTAFIHSTIKLLLSTGYKKQYFMRHALHTFFIMLLTLGAAIWSAPLQAQTYVMNGTPVNDCDGIFTDSGGTGNPYGPNQNITTTICSNSTGLTSTHIQLTFSNVQILAGDLLQFYDGPNTSAPLMGNHAEFEDDVFIIQASAANTSGCITLVFTSDGSGQGAGWRASINCVRSCQRIFADLAMAAPEVMPADTGWIDACPGQRIFLNGVGNYPQNGLIYQHSDLTSSFEWNFGDGGTAVGPNVSHIYDEPGGYTIQLTVTDQLGCKNINFLGQRVRIAPRPSFNITGDLPNNICSGDTLNLAAAVNQSGTDAELTVLPGVSTFSTGGIVADSLPLPDGNGVCYQSVIEISAFSPGQILTSINDLDGICVVMEHSWLHDLEITLTCPSGNEVTLHNITVPNSTEGAGATFLGIPNDPDNPPGSVQPGIGWEYCWTADATRGTWRQYSTANNPGTLPPGDYNSFTPLSNFVGCPLNGSWTLEVCDRWAIDNGMIFEWSINFAPEIFPDLEQFSPAIVDYSWQNNPTIFSFAPDSIAAAPQNAGTAVYEFVVTDEYGCVWDSTVNISVLPQTHPNCVSCDTRFNEQEDVVICEGQSAPLNVGPAPGTQIQTPITFEAFPQAPFGFRLHGPSNPFNGVINVNSVAPNPLTQPALQIASVCVDISTDWNSDLVLSLRAPNGSLMELSSGNGGASDNYRNTCFTPNAATPITAGTGPFTGNFRPEGNWTNLSGTVNGNWTLVAVDQLGINDVGEIHSWSITFNSTNSFTYTWTPATGLSCNNCPTPTANPLTPVNYRVQMTDAYGCVVRDTITVTPLSPLQAPQVSCEANDDAQAIFTWTTSGFTQFEINVYINGVAQGWTGPVATPTYLVEGYPSGTDVMLEVRPYFTAAPLCDIPIGSSSCTLMGCPSSLPPPVIDNITAIPVLCNGGNTGSATVTVSGGAEPYSYRWSHSLAQIASTAAFLEAGSYQVTVTDANGCQVTAAAEVTEPDPISISFTSSAVNCRDGNDGQAQAQAAGGVGPYAYVWNNQEQGAQIDQLVAGTYRVTVTDANGCTAESSIQVTQPTTGVSAQAAQSLSGCFGESNNEATVTATGGTGPYAYAWQNGQTTATAVNLAPGSYTVVVTDTKDCETEATVIVADLEPITFELLASQPTCHDYANGSMSITLISGGAGQAPTDYTFLWSTGNSAISVANLPGNVTYSATVTDQQGCKGEASRTLDNPDPITFSLSATPASCFGFNDGEALVSSVSGPNDTYTYRWDNNTGAQTSAVATGLAAGEYIVFITDNEGCQTSGTAVVSQPPALAISFSVQDNGCYGEAKGQITASPSGGVGNFTVQWSNGGSGLQVTNLQAGMYQSTLTDANGCTLVSSTEVTHPDPIEAEVKPTDVSCFGGRNGSFDVSAAGGTPPYQYSLNNRDYVGSSNLIGLRAGAYSVYVRDAKGCLFSTPATLAEPGEFTIDAGPDLTIIYGDSIQLQAALVNAAPPAEIIWLAPYEGTLSCTECPTPYARPEYTIDYEVYAIDVNGCEATDLLRVIVEKVKVIAVPTGFTPNGDGENDLLRVHGRPGSQILSFQIFDRWGELVYQGGNFPVNDANTGWDGSYRDQPLNAGVYLWVLRVRYDDSQEEVLRGQTTLIR